MRTVLLLAVAAALHPGVVFAQSSFSAETPGREPEVPVRKASAVAKPAAAQVASEARPVSSMEPGATFRANDTFRLSLSGMPAQEATQFDKPFTIGSDGYFNIPLAGQIRAQGLTQSQLERAIERKLIETEIFRFPTATIYVEAQTRWVTVGGAVRNPSRVPWSSDLTLLSAVSAASGGGDFASDKIELIRGGKKSVYSKKRIERDPTQDPRLMPGDRIEHR